MVPSPPASLDVQRDGRSDSLSLDATSLQSLAERIALAHRQRLVQPDLCEDILRLFEGSRHCSIAVEGKAWLVESADFLRPGHLNVSLLPRAKTLAGLACTSGRQIASQGKRLFDLIPLWDRSEGQVMVATPLMAAGSNLARVQPVGALQIVLQGPFQSSGVESRMVRFAQLLGPLVQQSGAELVKDMEFFCSPPIPEPSALAQEATAEGSETSAGGYHSDDEPPGPSGGGPGGGASALPITEPSSSLLPIVARSTSLIQAAVISSLEALGNAVMATFRGQLRKDVGWGAQQQWQRPAGAAAGPSKTNKAPQDRALRSMRFDGSRKELRMPQRGSFRLGWQQRPVWLTFRDPQLEERYSRWSQQRLCKVETAVLLFMLAVLVISSGTSLPTWQLALLGPLYGLMFLASILPTWYTERRKLLLSNAAMLYTVSLASMAWPANGSWPASFGACCANHLPSLVSILGTVSISGEAFRHFVPIQLAAYASAAAITASVWGGGFVGPPIGAAAVGIYAFQAFSGLLLPCAAMYGLETHNRAVFRSTTVR